MSLNVTLLAVIVLMVWMMIRGYKKGMVKSVISFVSLIITSVVVVLLGNAVRSYYDGEIFNVVVMVVLLCLVGIIRHILDVIFFSAKGKARVANIIRIIHRYPAGDCINKIKLPTKGVLSPV